MWVLGWVSGFVLFYTVSIGVVEVKLLQNNEPQSISSSMALYICVLHTTCTVACANDRKLGAPRSPTIVLCVAAQIAAYAAMNPQSQQEQPATMTEEQEALYKKLGCFELCPNAQFCFLGAEDSCVALKFAGNLSQIGREPRPVNSVKLRVLI